VAAAALVLWREPLPPAIETGLRGLDRVIGGLRAESFAILNAPPGRGKSCLTIQVSRFIVETGRSLVYLSSELSARQVIARMVAQIRRCGWLGIFESGPSEAELIARDLGAVPLRVVRLQRGMVIRDVLDRAADEDGVAPVLALDYLQHAARRLAIEDRRLAVGSLVDDIGTWATDTRSSGLVVSAVSRGNYRPDDDATAEDFLGSGKEAGEIECDASVEIFLQSELPPEGGSAPAKLHISKHRFGPSGQTVGLIFDGAIGMFRDDPFAALSELEARCLREVGSGARSGADVLERLKDKDKGVRKEFVYKALRSLRSNRMIDGPPYVVLEAAP
jgi:replicative DNA helicase